MAGTKTLHVGVLTPVNALNPREVQDYVTALAVMQVFETPYAQPTATGRAPEPLLFQERLRQEPLLCVVAGMVDATPVVG